MRAALGGAIDDGGLRGGRCDNGGSAGGHDLGVDRADLRHLFLRHKLLRRADKGAVLALVEALLSKGILGRLLGEVLVAPPQVVADLRGEVTAWGGVHGYRLRARCRALALLGALGRGKVGTIGIARDRMAMRAGLVISRMLVSKSNGAVRGHVVRVFRHVGVGCRQVQMRKAALTARLGELGGPGALERSNIVRRDGRGWNSSAGGP